MQKIRRVISELIAWLLVLFAVASCSTPEKLIDKAVKKDPTILEEYTDTVSFTLLTVDSVLVEVGDTVFYHTFTKELEYDTVINYNLINIERRKTRQEIRKAAKLDKLRLKLEAKIHSQNLKNQRIITKLEKRLEAKENRQSNRFESREKRSSKFWLGFAVGILSVIFMYFTVGVIRARYISRYNQ